MVLVGQTPLQNILCILVQHIWPATYGGVCIYSCKRFAFVFFLRFLLSF